MHKILRKVSEYLPQVTKTYPVISITGPRQSGKTTLCKSFFKDLDYINLEDPGVRDFALEDPRGLLEKYPQGLIIDEIQYAPKLTSYIQVRVDEDDFNGIFVLTGSQNFQIRNTLSQSLAGRVALITLLPFSLTEIQTNFSNFNSDDYLFTGFYPRIYDKKQDPTFSYSNYIATYIERDIRQLEHVKDLNLFQKFIKLCAGRVGQLLNIDSLASDTGVSSITVRNWINLLEASYILYRLPPFFENIGKRLIKSPKLYFYDVGLASYLIGINDIKQLETHPLKGPLFENMVISEVLKNKYNHLKENDLMFYRDSNGNEIDLLIPNAQVYHLIEIKSAKTINKEYFKNLKKFKKTDRKILIYDGKESRTQSEIEIYPFKKLPTF